MSKEIRCLIPLLGPDGRINEEGWARHPYFAYEPSSLKRGRRTAVERFMITDKEKGWNLSTSIVLSAGKTSSCIAYADLVSGKAVMMQTSGRQPIPRPRIPSSSTDDGSIHWTDKDKTMTMTYMHKGASRYVVFNAPGMELPGGMKGLLGDFSLQQDYDDESLSMAYAAESDSSQVTLEEQIMGLRPSGGFVRKAWDKHWLCEDGASAMMTWIRSNCRQWPTGTRAMASSGTLAFSFTTGSQGGAIWHEGKLTRVEDISIEDGHLHDEAGLADLVFEERCRVDIPLGRSYKSQEGHGFFSGTLAGWRITGMQGLISWLC